MEIALIIGTTDAYRAYKTTRPTENRYFIHDARGSYTPASVVCARVQLTENITISYVRVCKFVYRSSEYYRKRRR